MPRDEEDEIAWPERTARIFVREVMSELLMQVEEQAEVRRVGLEPEGRKYIPHVTLARLRESSSRQVADYLAMRAPYRSARFTVSRFVLFSSRASVGGGPYVVEAAYPLSEV